MKEKDYQNVYRHSSYNCEEVKRSQRCGCFYCKRIFPATDIVDYVDAGQTALCPYCGIDAVIGDASRVALTLQLLSEIYNKYFGGSVKQYCK